PMVDKVFVTLSSQPETRAFSSSPLIVGSILWVGRDVGWLRRRLAAGRLRFLVDGERWALQPRPRATPASVALLHWRSAPSSAMACATAPRDGASATSMLRWGC